MPRPRKQPNGYNLRPPPSLREKLEEAARENRRTLHSEILIRLERSFREQYRQI